MAWKPRSMLTPWSPSPMARSRSPRTSDLLTTTPTIASISRRTSDCVWFITISSATCTCRSKAYPIASGVEKQRRQHLDLHFIAHNQIGVGFDQRHQLGAVCHLDMQAALVAQVLDPPDPSDRRPTPPLANPQVLGADADCRRL